MTETLYSNKIKILLEGGAVGDLKKEDVAKIKAKLQELIVTGATKVIVYEYPCLYCNKSFRSGGRLIGHLKKHDYKFVETTAMDGVIYWCENNGLREEFVQCHFNPLALYALCKYRLKTGQKKTFEELKNHYMKV